VVETVSKFLSYLNLFKPVLTSPPWTKDRTDRRGGRGRQGGQERKEKTAKPPETQS